MGQSKRRKEISKLFDAGKEYTLEEAVDFLKKAPQVKFDQSVELSMKLGVDPRKADQLVRGTVSLPHGTGKTIRVLVITKGPKEEEAKSAGADYVGNDDYIEKIKGGWTDFDALIVTPDMMREVGKLGKILGPRGLMPTPKAGTVTTDIAKAVTEIKAGKIEFKVDKSSLINAAVGKLSFNPSQIIENILEYLKAIVRAKPASAKGVYIKSLFVSSTMGPGLKINLKEIPS